MKRKKIKHPPLLGFKFLKMVIAPSLKKKNQIIINTDNLKVRRIPRVIIANHPSAMDFAYCSMVLKRRFNCVTGLEHLYNKKTRWILRKLHVIPKKLFNPDSNAIKKIIQAIKQSHDILIMPEGRLSSAGKIGIMPEGIEKLLKKLATDVVVIKINGAYLAKGKWSKTRHSGVIEIIAETAITKEQINDMSIDQISSIITEKLAYNDFEWLNDHPNYHYHSSNMTAGLDNLLYLCPQCHQEFTMVANQDHFSCSSCGLDLILNSRYQFIKDEQVYHLANIAQWFDFQLETAQQEIINGKSLETAVVLKKAIGTGIKKEICEVGSGICYYDQSGFIYQGTDETGEVKYQFDRSRLLTLPFSCGLDFEIYHDDDYLLFCPIDNPKQAVKWSVYVEANYHLQLNNPEIFDKK